LAVDPAGTGMDLIQGMKEMNFIHPWPSGWDTN
jgi:hypothetical protein